MYKQCTVGFDIGARTNYEKTFDDLYAAGLKDNVQILFYDDIAEKPEDFIDQIYDFIELEHVSIKNETYIKELSEKVYETKGKRAMPERLEARLKLYYKRMLERMIEKYEIDFPKKWIEFYDM